MFHNPLLPSGVQANVPSFASWGTQPVARSANDPSTRTQQPIVTGTGVLAIKFNGGVMMASDTLGATRPIVVISVHHLIYHPACDCESQPSRRGMQLEQVVGEVGCVNGIRDIQPSLQQRLGSLRIQKYPEL
jgi:hypothetical protein